MVKSNVKKQNLGEHFDFGNTANHLTYDEAFQYITNNPNIQYYTTGNNAQFTAKATQTKRTGKHKIGTNVICFISIKGTESARAYSCCWGSKTNCNKTHIDCYTKAIIKSGDCEQII